MNTTSNMPTQITGQKRFNACVLHIELTELRPKVWRRLSVPDTIRVSELHKVLIAVMGWEGRHSHHFNFVRGIYGDTLDAGAASKFDESKITLKEALSGTTFFKWVYDFNCLWVHRIKLAGIVESQGLIRHATCSGGANSCPPENIGCALSYANFVYSTRKSNRFHANESGERSIDCFQLLPFSRRHTQYRLDSINLSPGSDTEYHKSIYLQRMRNRSL